MTETLVEPFKYSIDFMPYKNIPEVKLVVLNLKRHEYYTSLMECGLVILSLEFSTIKVTTKPDRKSQLHIAPATNERHLYNLEAQKDLGHVILDHSFRMKGLDIKMDGPLDVDFNLYTREITH